MVSWWMVETVAAAWNSKKPPTALTSRSRTSDTTISVRWNQRRLTGRRCDGARAAAGLVMRRGAPHCAQKTSWGNIASPQKTQVSLLRILRPTAPANGRAALHGE